jgi:exosortase
VDAAFAASLAIAAVTLYGSTAKGLVDEWLSSPDASYGILLAAVAIVVSFERRHTCARLVERHAPAKAAVAVLACAALLGAEIFLVRLSAIAMLVGAIWFLAGPAVLRTLGAPLIFLLIAIPLPALIANRITLPLQFVASGIAETTLAAVGVPVYRDGNLLELQGTVLEVAEACSGLRSIVSLAALGVVLAWAAEMSTGRRIALVALTTPVAIATNGLRIAATGIATEFLGPQIASGRWHTFTGWVTFVASLAVLLQVQRALARAHWIRVPPASARPGAAPTVAPGAASS